MNVTKFVMKNFMHVSIHAVVTLAAQRNVVRLTRLVLVRVMLHQQPQQRQRLQQQPLMVMLIQMIAMKHAILNSMNVFQSAPVTQIAPKPAVMLIWIVLPIVTILPTHPPQQQP